MGALPLCHHTPAAVAARAPSARAPAGRPCTSAQLAAPLHSKARQRASRIRAYKVEIEHDGQVTTLEVEEGSTILETALDSGLELSHDCKMGVCMTCPARLVDGRVDQSTGMLDEDAKAKGYALLCVSEPLSDCRVRVITEEEILNEVLVT